jgi:hypothetical protein
MPIRAFHRTVLVLLIHPEWAVTVYRAEPLGYILRLSSCEAQPYRASTRLSIAMKFKVRGEADVKITTSNKFGL